MTSNGSLTEAPADGRPGGGPLRWADLSWPEIGAHLRRIPSEVGLLPVGATEQHGPHLPSGTDTIVAAALAEAVSARTGAPVLPTVSVACSYGHGRQLPGTLSLTPELLADTVRQIVEWAAHSGLRRIIVINGHFGNYAALAVAGDHLRLERPDLRVAVRSWWDATPEILAEVTVDGADIHANRAETSMMLVVAPQMVRMDLAAQADDPDRTGDLVFRYTAPALSVNGVTGRPSEATAELGTRLFELTVGALCDLVERGRLESPPLPSGAPGDLSQPLERGVAP
jgi:creatinine amidohydrolase